MLKYIIVLLALLAPCAIQAQAWADDSNLQDVISGTSAFGDDETKIVVVEFWAEFNKDNAFAEWNEVDAKYVRVDIAKAPAAKKKYRIRMAPTIIIFKNGIKEVDWKAGLDLECPVTLAELTDAIEEAKTASQF